MGVQNISPDLGKLFPHSPESAAMFGDTYSMTHHSESPLPVIHGLKMGLSFHKRNYNLKLITGRYTVTVEGCKGP